MIRKNLNFNDFKSLIQTSVGAAVYFSNSNCSVCTVLRPKIEELFKANFPMIDFYHIPIEDCPEITGQLSIFEAPMLIVYFEGKEFYRVNKNISINNLKSTITKPYLLLFS